MEWKAFRIEVEEKGQIVAGTQMLIKALLLGLVSVAYIPQWPVGKWLENRMTTQLLSRIYQIARRHRLIFLKIELPLSNNATIDEIVKQHFFRESGSLISHAPPSF